jgi:PPM family protein phosphatase
MVTYASRSHAGRIYDHNEDSLGIDAARGRWLVADGMGGHASGEVASAIVRDTIMNSAGLTLAEAVLEAHRAVGAAAHEEHLRGMGSTVVALELIQGHGEVVWVGDSRAYLFRRGTLRPISRDHSFVELLRDSDGISEAEIRAHPHRNLVTQTLGIGDAVPSTVDIELRPGDWLMLCSDGLNDELEDSEIAAHLRRSRNPQMAVSDLVDAALAKGGRDNVSVVIVAIDADDVPRKSQRARAWLPTILGVVGALLLGSVLLFWLR